MTSLTIFCEGVSDQGGLGFAKGANVMSYKEQLVCGDTGTKGIAAIKEKERKPLYFRNCQITPVC